MMYQMGVYCRLSKDDGENKVSESIENQMKLIREYVTKSIGELVIDTPCPALAEAIYNATGVRVRELPITPEKIAMGILKKKGTDENS